MKSPPELYLLGTTEIGHSSKKCRLNVQQKSVEAISFDMFEVFHLVLLVDVRSIVDEDTINCGEKFFQVVIYLLDFNILLSEECGWLITWRLRTFSW